MILALSLDVALILIGEAMGLITLMVAERIGR